MHAVHGRVATRGPLALLMALSITAAAGCENDPTEFLMTFDPCEPLVLQPGESFGPEDVAAVQDAIDLWRDVAAVELTLEAAPGAAMLPILGTDTEVYFDHFDDTRGVIFLSRHMTDRRQRAIVLGHELGHAFGLYHVDPDDRASVMNSGNRDVPPTSGDAAALQQVWGDCVTGELAAAGRAR